MLVNRHELQLTGLYPKYVPTLMLAHCLKKMLLWSIRLPHKRCYPRADFGPAEGAYDESTQQMRDDRSHSSTLFEGRQSRESPYLERVNCHYRLPSQIGHPSAQARFQTKGVEETRSPESLSGRGGSGFGAGLGNMWADLFQTSVTLLT